MPTVSEEKIETTQPTQPITPLDKAWAFLPKIAGQVAVMPPELQQQILDVGRRMKASEMSFTIMVENENSKLPTSPAKEQALNEQKANAGKTASK